MGINFVVTQDLLLFFIRLVLGLVMLYYGVPKIKSLKKNAEDFTNMGFRPGFFWGTIVAFVESVGGILMILGFYTEVAAALFGSQMIIGTFWKMKAKKPFTDYSYDVLLLTLAAVIFVFGAGFYAFR